MDREREREGESKSKSFEEGGEGGWVYGEITVMQSVGSEERMRGGRKSIEVRSRLFGDARNGGVEVRGEERGGVDDEGDKTTNYEMYELMMEIREWRSLDEVPIFQFWDLGNFVLRIPPRPKSS